MIVKPKDTFSGTTSNGPYVFYKTKKYKVVKYESVHDSFTLDAGGVHVVFTGEELKELFFVAKY